MQNLRIRKNNCLTFFDPGANTHLIDGTLEESENFQKFSDNQADLGVIGGGVITAGLDFIFFVFFFFTLRNIKLTKSCIFEKTTVEPNIFLQFLSKITQLGP